MLPFTLNDTDLRFLLAIAVEVIGMMAIAWVYTCARRPQDADGSTGGHRRPTNLALPQRRKLLVAHVPIERQPRGRGTVNRDR